MIKVFHAACQVWGSMPSWSQYLLFLSHINIWFNTSAHNITLFLLISEITFRTLLPNKLLLKNATHISQVLIYNMEFLMQKLSPLKKHKDLLLFFHHWWKFRVLHQNKRNELVPYFLNTNHSIATESSQHVDDNSGKWKWREKKVNQKYR